MLQCSNRDWKIDNFKCSAPTLFIQALQLHIFQVGTGTFKKVGVFTSNYLSTPSFRFLGVGPLKIRGYLMHSNVPNPMYQTPVKVPKLPLFHLFISHLNVLVIVECTSIT
jgi:hypothetical protein